MIAGRIWVVYGWHEGLSTWAVIPIGKPMGVPEGVDLYLSVGWQNTGDEPFTGRVAVLVTRPDGTTLPLVSEDTPLAPGGSIVVPTLPSPLVVSQFGLHTIDVILIHVPTGAVLDNIQVGAQIAGVGYTSVEVWNPRTGVWSIPGLSVPVGSDLRVRARWQNTSEDSVQAEPSLLVTRPDTVQYQVPVLLQDPPPGSILGPGDEATVEYQPYTLPVLGTYSGRFRLDGDWVAPITAVMRPKGFAKCTHWYVNWYTDRLGWKDDGFGWRPYWQSCTVSGVYPGEPVWLQGYEYGAGYGIIPRGPHGPFTLQPTGPLGFPYCLYDMIAGTQGIPPYCMEVLSSLACRRMFGVPGQDCFPGTEVYWPMDPVYIFLYQLGAVLGGWLKVKSYGPGTRNYRVKFTMYDWGQTNVLYNSDVSLPEGVVVEIPVVMSLNILERSTFYGELVISAAGLSSPVYFWLSFVALRIPS